MGNNQNAKWRLVRKIAAPPIQGIIRAYDALHALQQKEHADE